MPLQQQSQWQSENVKQKPQSKQEQKSEKQL